MIGHLASQIIFLKRELTEKDQLVNSLLDQISKCNTYYKGNQELSKNKVKPFVNKTLIEQDRFIETIAKLIKQAKNQAKK